MQALSQMIGRKAFVGGFLSPPSNPKAPPPSGSREVGIGEHSSWVGLLLSCFQQLSTPYLATQRLPWAR